MNSPSIDLEPNISKRHFSPIGLLEKLEHTTARVSVLDKPYLDSPNSFYWAIKTSGKGRSSGLDGIPVEYYQLFPDKWAQVYKLVYASQLKRARAYISLLYKKGDWPLPGNYWPLTLLNHDAKFGPKFLSYRPRSIHPKLLHPYHNSIYSAHANSLPGFAAICYTRWSNGCWDCAIGLAKAFDSVMWPALDLILQHYGLGETFCSSVRTFYIGNIVTESVNGTASNYFELGCGPQSPRHTFAFADDWTGILKHLRHTRKFVTAVGDYVESAGLTLNADKYCTLFSGAG
ncbi:putative reverse transcriptase domain-containing protein [Phytophthora infestans]|uniref:Putative reverse transcriptase domain-containing protein n=1 Tax=Phytophthora infestans TaxID=4787 RepID=A0A833TIQ0_PHYIN|nr:putative reverse transcriptase domain-containing protein [Phytophthora infestans]